MSENKPNASENSQNSADKKSSEVAQNENSSLLKLFGSLKDPVGDFLKLADAAKVRKSSKINSIQEGTGFTQLSFKGEFSSGSFVLEDLPKMIMDLFPDSNFRERHQKKFDVILGQAWLLNVEQKVATSLTLTVQVKRKPLRYN